MRKRNELVNIFSLNLDFDKTLPKSSTIFYGIELVHNDVQSTGEEQNRLSGETANISSRYPDGGNRYFTAGAYFSYKKNFQRSPMTFLTGLRYSFTGLNSRFTDTSFYKLPYNEIKLNNSAVTGNAGLVYHPGTLQLSLNFSSGFRAPNLDDVAKIFDSEPGNVVVPNENLKPEYLYNSDLGFSYRFKQGAKVQVNLFYSYLKDAMVRRDFQVDGQDSILYDGEMSKVQAVVNASFARIYGLSFLFDLQLASSLKFTTTLTYLKGTDDQGFALRHAPPLYGSSALVFEKYAFKLALSANYNAEVAFKNLAPTERDKSYLYASDDNGNPYAPAWWTLNLKGSYAFSNKFMATFGIENILDYRYRPYSSGITANGRNFIVAFRYSF
ncbi:MAG: TonB-dependent receptor [Bacteroidales bacterium]|nr:TonB-dependent receptor [Bacteroidales bacterium]